MLAYVILAALLLATQCAAHGKVISSRIRRPGPASEKACGTPFNLLWNGTLNGNDVSGPLYSSFTYPGFGPQWPGAPKPGERVVFDTRTCPFYLCQGQQYADNAKNLYTFKPGDQLPVIIEIRAPHNGTANVSIVDTETNTIIGPMLRYWPDHYAQVTTIWPGEYPPLNQVNFTLTMPDLGNRCNRPGKCVIQWWWWGRDSAPDQYYESCFDFVMNPVDPVPSSTTSGGAVASSTSRSSSRTSEQSKSSSTRVGTSTLSSARSTSSASRVPSGCPSVATVTVTKMRDRFDNYAYPSGPILVGAAASAGRRRVSMPWRW